MIVQRDLGALAVRVVFRLFGTLLAQLLVLFGLFATVVALSSGATAAPVYGYDAPTHAYDSGARSVQAHTSEAAPGASHHGLDGPQGTVANASGPFSGSWRLSVADDTGSLNLAGFSSGARNGAAGSVPRTLDELSAQGAQPDRNGLTQAGRALQKHASRAGNTAYPTVPAKQLASVGQYLLDDILTNPLTAQRNYVHPTFGPVREFLLPEMGARFEEFGRLIGFL